MVDVTVLSLSIIFEYIFHKVLFVDLPSPHALILKSVARPSLACI